MNLADVHGHRSRSRAAYYAIANELVANQILRGTASYTDVVTVIEMRDMATVNQEIFLEPVTWMLHNKIVDLADEPLRGKGNGNYIPALKLASKILEAND